MKVSRLAIFIGVDANGQVVQQLHMPAENKTIEVEPGKYATITVKQTEDKVRVAEIPLGGLGWEYDPLPE